MFEKALKLDGDKLKKTNQISAKRPSEYWLIFFKKIILIKQPIKFRLRYLFFLAPLGVLIFICFNLISDESYDIESHFAAFMFSLVISIILNIIAHLFFDKNYYRDIVSFNHLARFIISIKGDVFKNLIQICLNFEGIESNKHSIKAHEIGLKNISGKRYRAYGMERYRANLVFKDNTVCTTSLYQYTVKVTTTKRRASGKVKTKSKHKHKFLYMLSLKLATENYHIINENELKKYLDDYDISVFKESTFYFVKIKLKEKRSFTTTEIHSAVKQQESIFTRMLDFLNNKQIITPKI